jgi:hypothetical protein
MGMMDDMKDKARDAIEKNRDKIDEGIQKAAGFAKEKAGSQHADKIDQMAERGKSALDRMDDSGQADEPGRPNPQP